MTEPTCPKCRGTTFAAKEVVTPGTPRNTYIVYCTGCGHIVGCYRVG